jgi:hypothetical protein
MGMAASGGGYMISNVLTGKSFDTTDFLVTSAVGAVEGGVSAIPGIGAGGRILHLEPLVLPNRHSATVLTAVRWTGGKRHSVEALVWLRAGPVKCFAQRPVEQLPYQRAPLARLCQQSI